ncbi:MAG: AsmA family protein, partial [Syntrophobacteria bacterium]
MSRTRKIFALIFAVFLVCVAVLFLFLRFYMTKERITALVKPPLEKYLHRKVSFTDASAGLRGFRVEGLEIRKEGAAAPLVKSEKLELRWRPMALLKRRLEIQSLVFSKPEITLIRRQDGALNIADLLSRKTPPETAAGPEKEGGEEPPGISLFVSLFSMEDGRFTLVDRSCAPETT